MENIKLVIWDLDETFWKGTLSEEDITPDERNIRVVKELTNRGIINSIVSKNDLNAAKNKLIELGVWDYFIFPAIAWSPKGTLIQEIIQKCQLRDNNVLFLDDNHLNLEEAKFYNPNIQALLPDFIPQILSHPSLQGKDDREHSRLKQYKILEQKDHARQNHGSNIDFLRSSHIKVQYIENLLPFLDRVLELLERTNQLNFTKLRHHKDQIKPLLLNPTYKSALIQVKDDYGDYGIVGFYCLDLSQNKLVHFVFSCRILNLGVAQYTFAKLGFPKLTVIPDVAEELNQTQPDWIEEVTDLDLLPKSNGTDRKRLKILFRGGCDYGQMVFYLKNNDIDTVEEINYVSKDNFEIHQTHTQVLLDSQNLSQHQKNELIDTPFTPFVDENFYQTKVFDGQYDCLVYSLHMDYTQELYQHKKSSIQLPIGGYHTFWTDESAHPKILKRFRDKGSKSVTKKSLMQFRAEFEHIGQISPERLVENLSKVRELLPANIPLILINGAEVKHSQSLETHAKTRHETMNATVDDFVGQSPNTFLLDIRKIIRHESQLTFNIRHFNRETYKDIALELLNILNSVFGQQVQAKIGPKSILLSRMAGLVQKAKQIKRSFSSFICNASIALSHITPTNVEEIVFPYLYL